MDKLFAFLLAVLISIFSLSGCQNKSESDRQKEMRIISLSPHITEILYALEVQDRLVAVTDFCAYPPAAATKERIGGLLNPNIERITMLKPTHLFGLPAHENLDQQLRSLGFNIIMMPNDKVDDVLKSMQLIGELTGKMENARRLIDRMNASFDSLRKEAAGLKRIGAALLIGRTRGSLQNITVAGKQTYINEIWEMVGGRNIYDDLPTLYGTINLESLLLRDPEVIIEFDMNKDHTVSRIDPGSEWDVLGEIRAIRKGQFFLIGGNHTMIPGPRMTWLAGDFKQIIGQIERSGQH